MRTALCLLILTTSLIATAGPRCSVIIAGSKPAYQAVFSGESQNLFGTENFLSAYFIGWNQTIVEVANEGVEPEPVEWRPHEVAPLYGRLKRRTLQHYQRELLPYGVELRIAADSDDNAQFIVDRTGRAFVTINDYTEEFELYFMVARVRYWHWILQRLLLDPIAMRIPVADGDDPLNPKFEAFLFSITPGSLSAATAAALRDLPANIRRSRPSFDLIVHDVGAPWILSISTSIRIRKFLVSLAENPEARELEAHILKLIRGLGQRIDASFVSLQEQFDYVSNEVQGSLDETQPRLAARIKRGRDYSFERFIRRIERAHPGIGAAYEEWKISPPE